MHKRRQRFEEVRAAQAEDIRRLNIARQQIFQREKKLKEAKKDHMALLTKGLDFLAEMELGRAPPRHLLAANIRLQNKVEGVEEEDSDEAEEGGFDWKEYITAIQGRLGFQQVRVAHMKQEMQRVELPPYGGEHGLRSYPRHQRDTAQAMRQLLLDELLPRIYRRLPFQFSAAITRKQLQSEQKAVQIERSHWLVKTEQARFKQVLLDVVNEVVEEGVEAEITSLFQQAKRVQWRVEKYRSDIVSEAIISAAEVSPAPSNSLVANVVSEMSKKRDFHLQTGKGKRFIHRNPLSRRSELRNYHRRVAKATKESASKGVLGRLLAKKRDVPTMAELMKRVHVESDFHPDDMVVVDVKDVVLNTDFPRILKDKAARQLPTLFTDDLADYTHLESVYWKAFAPKRDFLVKKKGQSAAAYKSLTCLRAAPNGRLIAAGTDAGTALVFDVRQLQLVKVLEPLRGTAAASIHSVAWSMDQSHVLVLDTSGVAVCWDLSYVPAVPPHLGKRRILLFPVDFHTPHIKVAAEQGAGEGDTADNDNPSLSETMLLTPRTATFHPSFNLALKQPSIMLGLAGGAIVKWNLYDASSANYSMLFGAIPRLPLDPPMPSASVKRLASHATTKEEKDEITKNAATLANSSSSSSSSSSSNKVSSSSFVRREFLQHHRHAIVYMGQVASSSSMVSVDSSGVVAVWPYNLKQFSGLGWFLPNPVYQLKCTMPVYLGGEANEKPMVVFDAGEAVGLPCPSSSIVLDKPEKARAMEIKWFRSLLGASSKHTGIIKEEARKFQASPAYKKLKVYLSKAEPVQETSLVEDKVLVLTYGISPSLDQTLCPHAPQHTGAQAAVHSLTFVTFQNGDTYLVRQVRQPFGISATAGQIVQVVPSSSRQELVVLLKYPNGYGTTMWKHTTPSYPTHHHNRGVAGVNNDTTNWPQGLSHTPGSPFLQVLLLDLQPKGLNHSNSSSSSSSLPSETEEVNLKATCFSVSVPLPSADCACHIAVTPVLDEVCSDYVAVQLPSHVLIFSLTTASLVFSMPTESSCCNIAVSLASSNGSLSGLALFLAFSRVAAQHMLAVYTQPEFEHAKEVIFQAEHERKAAETKPERRKRSRSSSVRNRKKGGARFNWVSGRAVADRWDATPVSLRSRDPDRNMVLTRCLKSVTLSEFVEGVLSDIVSFVVTSSRIK